jgi:hypothetical protein
MKKILTILLFLCIFTISLYGQTQRPYKINNNTEIYGNLLLRDTFNISSLSDSSKIFWNVDRFSITRGKASGNFFNWSGLELIKGNKYGSIRLGTASKSIFINENPSSIYSIEIEGTCNLTKQLTLDDSLHIGKAIIFPDNSIQTTASNGFGWLLTGNLNTDTSVHFIGTKDNMPLIFKVNGINFGLLNYSDHNISLGDSILLKNTNGNYNVGLGSKTLYNNTEGADNFSIGNTSLYNNTLGSSNISIGYETMLSNTEGSDNFAVGKNALRTNVLGSRNIAIGYYSLYSNIGNNNIAIGYFSGTYQANLNHRFYLGGTKDYGSLANDTIMTPIYGNNEGAYTKLWLNAVTHQKDTFYLSDSCYIDYSNGDNGILIINAKNGINGYAKLGATQSNGYGSVSMETSNNGITISDENSQKEVQISGNTYHYDSLNVRSVFSIIDNSETDSTSIYDDGINTIIDSDNPIIIKDTLINNSVILLNDSSYLADINNQTFLSRKGDSTYIALTDTTASIETVNGERIIIYGSNSSILNKNKAILEGLHLQVDSEAVFKDTIHAVKAIVLPDSSIINGSIQLDSISGNIGNITTPLNTIFTTFVYINGMYMGCGARNFADNESLSFPSNGGGWIDIWSEDGDYARIVFTPSGVCSMPIGQGNVDYLLTDGTINVTDGGDYVILTNMLNNTKKIQYAIFYNIF